MEALHVFALDREMNRASGIINYSSLLWKRRYHEPGTFAMQVDRSAYDPSWAYICCDDRPEVGIIQKRTYDDDYYASAESRGADTVTLEGFFLEARMNDFVFLVEETETEERYERPPSYSFNPNKRKAWQSDGGFVYTYDREGNLSGYDPINHVRKPLADVTTNDDGSITVKDLSDAVYTVSPIPDDKYWPASGDFCYFATNESGETEFRSDVHGPDYGTDPEKDVKHEAWVTDSYGDTWVRGNDGLGNTTWAYASGAKTKAADTYTYKLRSWKRRTNNGWYTVQVKGPWQRTEIGDPEKSIDPVAHLMAWVRMFFKDTMTYVEPGFEAEARVIDPSLSRLGDLLYKELEPEGASFRVRYDFEQDEFVFEVYRGVDRTQAQSENAWATFSDRWGTLYGYRYSEDVSNYRNTCHVLYDYEEPVWDGNVPLVAAVKEWKDGVYAELVGYKIPYSRRRGYETVRLEEQAETDGEEVATGLGEITDSEIFLDLRSEKPEGDGEWSRSVYKVDERPTFKGNMKAAYDAFKDFQGRGRTELTNNYGVIRNLDTGIIDSSDYLEVWDVGDLVDVAVHDMGVSYTARITGVDEAYSPGNASVSVIIGKEMPTTEEKASLL